MELNKGQEQGLKIAVERYKNKEPYTVISGWAGTGKSTLVTFIIDALGIDRDEVAYVAYTGKAANVLKTKGCPNATTIHKLLYYSTKDKDGKFHFKKRPHLDAPYKLIICDEVSMVSKSLWEDMLSHHVHIIALGDDQQLPPVSKGDELDILNHPHIRLTEIMRQALDSEIIRLSIWVREGNPLSAYNGENEEVMVINKRDITTGMLEWADQILCATNNNRIKLNKEMRALKGLPTDELVPGDKIIGLSNHWDFFSNEGSALTNGCIGYVDNFWLDTIKYPKFITKNTAKIANLNFITDDGTDTFVNIPVDYNYFFTNQPALTPQEEFKIAGYNQNHKGEMYYDIPYLFTFGHAITVWKAQGSQFNKVLLFEEGFPFDKEEHRKYLYTGITRSVSRIVVVRS